VTPQDIPQELIDMLDADAGKAHSRTGPVLTSLARILARYDEIRVRALIEASSLGTPGASALRARTPPGVVAEVRQRAAELSGDDLEEIKANLASLNEVIGELVGAASADPAYRQMVRDTLRSHSRSLGFTFQEEA
jgi:hypothetical protein